MIITAKVDVRLRGLTALRNELASPRGPVRRALLSWELTYRAFALRRFDRFSRGGGDWPKLKEATRRRKRSSAILVDHRELRLGLQSGIGRLTGTGTSLRLGFTRKTRHRRAKMSIAALATIHDLGLGVVPRRRILAQPDRPTRTRMAADVKKAALEVLR